MADSQPLQLGRTAYEIDLDATVSANSPNDRFRKDSRTRNGSDSEHRLAALILSEFTIVFLQPKRRTWTQSLPQFAGNRGTRGIGQKAPLKVKDIWAVRVRLQLQPRTRDLAPFDLASIASYAAATL